MKNSFLLLILICFGCCNSISQKHEYAHTSFYSDIDIFKMKGERLIKGHKPLAPCIELDSIDSNNIHLTYWHTNKDRYSRNYIKENDYWVAHYPVLADTLDLIVYDYVGKNKIIHLEYQNDSSKDNLKIATVYKDSVQKIYLFKNSLRIPPNPDINIEDAKFDDQIEGKGITEYHIKNGNLQLIRTNIFNSPESPVRDTSYFKIDDHSIFWWSEFGK